MAQTQGFLKKHSIITMIFGILLCIGGIVVLSNNSTMITILMAVALIISGLFTIQALFTFKFTSKNWKWATLFKGIISIILGVVGIIYSKESTKIIMYVMGAQMVVSGVIALIDACILKKDTGLPVGSVVSDGIFSLVVALVLFLFPTFVSSTLGIILGVILILVGLALFFWAFQIRKVDKAFETIETKGETLDEK